MAAHPASGIICYSHNNPLVIRYKRTSPFFGPQITRYREWQHAYFVKIAIFGCLQILFPFFGRVMSQGAAGEHFELLAKSIGGK